MKGSGGTGNKACVAAGEAVVAEKEKNKGMVYILSNGKEDINVTKRYYTESECELENPHEVDEYSRECVRAWCYVDDRVY